MMKTYIQELRGQVRGNARLRRRLDAREDEIRRLSGHVGTLVALLDKLGHGDDIEVVRAAGAIGWRRSREDAEAAMRAQIRYEIEKAFGVQL